jgi:mRNA-degrading endonuclease RelE of RelBE toxin-antitoxin system
MSRARVKPLREPSPTQYRLRVGEFRFFYDHDAPPGDIKPQHIGEAVG